MKITFELNGCKYEITDPEAISIDQAMEMFENILRAAGFTFDGTLDIVDD